MRLEADNRLEDLKTSGTGSEEGLGVVTVPAWSRFPWLRAGFSTRQGGDSSIYGSPGEQNLGFTKDDAPGIVAANRQRFLSAVRGKDELTLLTVQQVHSGTIQTVDSAVEVKVKGLMTAEGKPVLPGDGLMSRTPGLMLGVVTADCVPVLVADTRTHAVAAFHAGWRGTVARIAEHGVESMRLQFGSRVEDLVAAVGPGISRCCFAVGEDVKHRFLSQFRYALDLFSETETQLHVDLMEANRRQLMDAGIPATNISVVGECTACTRLKDGRRKYFSHRAEHGFTGRMLNVIGAVE